jgi:hypothetical protein
MKVVGGALAVIACLAIAPAVAQGADRYVDAETGADAGACTEASPCETIAFALGISIAGEQVLIDNGAYPEAVTVSGGRSLTGWDFVDGDGTAPPTIDAGAGTAVTVPAGGASLIRDLRLRGDVAGVRLEGPAEVSDNVFDDPDATTASGVQVVNAAEGANIHDNTIFDPAPGSGRTRVGVSANVVSGVTVADNTIQGMTIGISVAGAPDPPIVVERNLIEGTQSASGTGAAIRVTCCVPWAAVIRANTIRNPATPPANGIVLQDDAVLERNEVVGHDVGVFASADTQGTTLAGDRLWGNNRGLWAFDNNPVPTRTSVGVTDATIVGNGDDIFVTQSELTLDSSIVGVLGMTSESSCAITFSRGDVIGDDPSGCDSFQTTASPGFADAAAGDFHLTPGSAMIDVGNPADPPEGAVDFDDDPRALNGVTGCQGAPTRRDIGADELALVPGDCEPPDTTIESGPQDGDVIREVTPTIGFSSDDPTATFQCSVDAAPFVPLSCSHQSQHILGPLIDGEHSFSVRAVDTADNADPEPPLVTFTVDTVAPDTTITKKPPKRLRRTKASFRFTASESAVTFECKLDAKPYKPCSSPRRLRVRNGRHTFRVRGIDEAENVDASPARHVFQRIKP